MATWTAPTFLAKLKADLEARPGMSDVDVFTAPPGDEMPATDALWIENVETTEEWAAIDATNRPKHETYQVNGGLWAMKSGAGTDVWTDALNRAAAILAELENEINDDPTFGGPGTFVGCTYFIAALTRYDMSQGITPKGRGVRIDFTITCMARKP